MGQAILAQACALKFLIAHASLLAMAGARTFGRSAAAKRAAREGGAAARVGSAAMGPPQDGPDSARLEDVTAWYLRKLPSTQRDSLRQVVQAAAASGRTLTVGTMCSGTDAPVPVLQKLAKVLRGLKVEHVFSCEFNKKKQGGSRRTFQI